MNAEPLLQHLDSLLVWARQHSSNKDLPIADLQFNLLETIRAEELFITKETSPVWFYRMLWTSRHNHPVQHRLPPNQQLPLLPGLPEKASPEDLATLTSSLAPLLPELTSLDSKLLQHVDFDGGSLDTLFPPGQPRPKDLDNKLHCARRRLRNSIELACRFCPTHRCLHCPC